MALAAPTSALVVSAELSLGAEFPADTAARTILGAIGSGERTFTTILRAAGVSQGTLNRSLNQLVHKGVVAAERPLSTAASRYRIDDPYLRFWLLFIAPRTAEIDRGRGDRVLDRIATGWTSWRGRAVEPVVREALRRLDTAAAVGGFWTRSNDVEVDLVGADRQPLARRVQYVGSVTWHDDRPFDSRDLGALMAARERVPGADADTGLVGVSRTGVTTGGLDRTWGPDELVDAWR